MIRLTAARSGEPIDILTVCTGNICRSPYIAGALAAAVPGLTIGGAGTAAMVGWEPVTEVLTALKAVGAPDPVPARQLTKRLVRSASFILTATAAHRGEVLRLDKTADQRTFTIKEAARLAGSYVAAGATPQERLADLAQHLLAEAEKDPWDHDDDLADPYGLDAAAYATMVTEVDAALKVIVRALSGEA